ncbi:MAG: hypothetical protein HQ596_07380 [Candidatus Saganbacteria bacterium]|nr:hypothetical protein [Candidatus Saganbacteria bacterium]
MALIVRKINKLIGWSKGIPFQGPKMGKALVEGFVQGGGASGVVVDRKAGSGDAEGPAKGTTVGFSEIWGAFERDEEFSGLVDHGLFRRTMMHLEVLDGDRDLVSLSLTSPESGLSPEKELAKQFGVLRALRDVNVQLFFSPERIGDYWEIDLADALGVFPRFKGLSLKKPHQVAAKFLFPEKKAIVAQDHRMGLNVSLYFSFAFSTEHPEVEEALLRFSIHENLSGSGEDILDEQAGGGLGGGEGMRGKLVARGLLSLPAFQEEGHFLGFAIEKAGDAQFYEPNEIRQALRIADGIEKRYGSWIVT